MPHHHIGTVVPCQHRHHISLCLKQGCVGDSNTTMGLATLPRAKAKVDRTWTSPSIVQTIHGTGVVVSKNFVSGNKTLSIHANQASCALLYLAFVGREGGGGGGSRVPVLRELDLLKLCTSNFVLLFRKRNEHTVATWTYAERDLCSVTVNVILSIQKWVPPADNPELPNF